MKALLFFLFMLGLFVTVYGLRWYKQKPQYTEEYGPDLTGIFMSICGVMLSVSCMTVILMGS